MKTYKAISLIVLILVGSPLFAQEHQTQYEIKGTELVNKASEKIRSYSALKIEFTYEMLNNEMDIDESMSGILFSAGDKYHMEVGGNLFISDGESIWNYIDDMEEVQISNAEDVEGEMNPTSILDDFEEHFRATFIRQDAHNGKRVDIIDLVPNTPQSFFKYRLALDARTNMVVYSAAYDRHGGTFTYFIDKIEENPQIPAGLFSFDESKYPGVFVNDLR